MTWLPLGPQPHMPMPELHSFRKSLTEPQHGELVTVPCVLAQRAGGSPLVASAPAS